MEIYAFVLHCALFSSVFAFTIPDAVPENINGSLTGIAESEGCKCKNGRCVTDNRGIRKCNCFPGHALQDENTCEPCDCGDRGLCMFVVQAKSAGLSYVKKCVCNTGSAEKDGKCVDCHCGEHSKCEFEGDEKICYCIDGYSEKDGVCTRCDCGFFGECSFKMGRKECICDDGYLEHDGYCKECNCGWYGNCSLKDGVKVCDCLSDYSDNNGKCEECDCGEHSYACGFENGEKVCVCNSDTIKRYQFEGRCIDCNCGRESDGCRYVDGRKVCQCFGGFVQKGDVCKVKCSYQKPCQHGGHCNNGICECLPGTSGEFCEVIEGCVDLCPKHKNINCTYDTKYEKPFCDCLENGTSFHPEMRECRKICRFYYSDCKNGGECSIYDNSRFCKCLEGTEGHFCEIVPECTTMDCGSEADCIFHVGKQSAVCRCHNEELHFDTKERRCKKRCSSDADCMNGGICVGENDNQFCKCLEGTNGDLCEEVSGCKAKDCGPEAQCVYDIERRIAVCKCSHEGFAFDPIEYKCRRTCSHSSDCLNGALCKGSDSFKFCRCTKGTEGDFCSKVVECDYKDCGADARCVYDERLEAAKCDCDYAYLHFDPATKTCKRQCHGPSDCENGGICEEEKSTEYDVLRFCRCLEGIEGDFCEKVTHCEYVDCGHDAECVFDMNHKTTFCSCQDKALSFDLFDKRCKRSCNDDIRCENGGKCVAREYYSFCECPYGTSGYMCEIIDDCVKHIDMCKDNSKCAFDDEKGKAICICPYDGEKYDSWSERCKRTCDEARPCHNGGECKYSGDYSFCQCLKGTSGDSCDTVDECEKLSCKGDSLCVFEIDRRAAECKCVDPSKKYDPLSEVCKLTCNSNEMCDNGGLCMKRGNYSFCQCKNGTSGMFCEKIDICESACGISDDVICTYNIREETAKCICKDYSRFDEETKTCRGCECENGHCKVVDGRLTCICNPEYGMKEGSCEACDCGKGANCTFGECSWFYGCSKTCICPKGMPEENGKCIACECGGKEISCDIEDGKKICVCPAGYAVEDGKCKKRWCTEKKCVNGKCEVINNEDVCSCFEGYFLDGDECRKQKCSETACVNGTCIVRYGGKEECICPAGYTLQKDICIRGECRQDTCFGGQCKIIDNELTCVCPEKFHLEGIGCYETQCEIQMCFGGKCVVEDGKEICTCREGYKLENDVCKQILCEEKNCFGGKCHLVDGKEECTCPDGYSVFDDVCRKDAS